MQPVGKHHITCLDHQVALSWAGDFFAGATAGGKAPAKNDAGASAVDYSKYNNSKSISSDAFFGGDPKQSDKVLCFQT